MRRLPAPLAPLALSFLLAPLAVAAPSDFPWELDAQPVDELALRLADGHADPHLALALVASVGLEASAAEPFHGAGWFRVALARTVDAAELITPARILGSLGAVEFATPIWTTAGGLIVAPTDTVLLRLEPGTDGVARLAPELLEVEAQVAGLERTFRARSPLTDGFAVLERLAALELDDAVDWAEPDAIFEGRSSFQGGPIIDPGDPLYSVQWALGNGSLAPGGFKLDLDVNEAWKFTKGSYEAGVLVLDVGVDMSHPDLTVDVGADFTDEDFGGGPGGPCDKHGTPVAGCVAAIHDNGIGVAGAAPEARLLSGRCLKALSSCSGNWTSQPSWTAEALDWGLQQGARVSVNSNFYNVHFTIVATTYATTRDQGMVHFSSAGNSGGAITWPASLDAVSAVTAMTAYGTLASFSSSGPEVAFTAPGLSIWSTDVSGPDGFVDGDTCMVSGTSYAAPYAAAVAALVLAMDPTLQPDQVEQVLRDTAGDLGAPGWDPKFGYGLTRAGDAVKHGAQLLRLLDAAPPQIALDVGGIQDLQLAAGPQSAGQPYLVVGGASGPALPVGDGLDSLPFNVDAYTFASAELAGQPPLLGFFGLLDQEGRAAAQIVIPPGSDPGLAGLELIHAYLVLSVSPLGFDGVASEPASLGLVASQGLFDDGPEREVFTVPPIQVRIPGPR